VVGSGLSSSLATVLSVLLLAAHLRALPTPPDPMRRARDSALVRTILRLGMPLAGQLVSEVGLFAATTILAGRMGALSVAGHQIAITLASFTFTVTVGIASATSVRVGFRVGHGDPAGARRAGLVGVAAAAAFMACTSLVFLTAPGWLARILSDDPRVLAASTPLILIAAVFQLSDGAQAVAAGALRGAGDTRVPFLITLFGYYAVGLSTAVVLAYGAGMGVRGLWWGLCAGLTSVALCLIARFARLSARPIARAGLEVTP
jgi:MATE family multidrug resistance protein